MRILIDADGCPVTNIAVSISKSQGLECIIVCDSSHNFSSDYAQVITVDKGADSADMKQCINVGVVIYPAVLVQSKDVSCKTHCRKPIILRHGNIAL